MAAHLRAADTHHPTRQVRTSCVQELFNRQKNKYNTWLMLFVFVWAVTGTWPPSRWCSSRGPSEIRLQHSSGTRWEESDFGSTLPPGEESRNYTSLAKLHKDAFREQRPLPGDAHTNSDRYYNHKLAFFIPLTRLHVILENVQNLSMLKV